MPAEFYFVELTLDNDRFASFTIVPIHLKTYTYSRVMNNECTTLYLHFICRLTKSLDDFDWPDCIFYYLFNG